MQEAVEKYIKCSFRICTPHQALLPWSNERA